RVSYSGREPFGELDSICVHAASAAPKKRESAKVPQTRVLRRLKGFLVETQGLDSRVVFVSNGETVQYYLPTEQLKRARITAPNPSRPGIRDIVSGKRLHFVCLTHPHADHGKDLVPVLQTHPEIAEFWHTTSDIRAFIYRVQEYVNYPSPVRDFAAAMNRDWA